MQLPEGVNGYLELKRFAESDPSGQRCLAALDKAMEELSVHKGSFPIIGDLVVRLSYVARDGCTLDFSECTEDEDVQIAGLMHKVADIYERWQQLLPE